MTDDTPRTTREDAKAYWSMIGFCDIGDDAIADIGNLCRSYIALLDESEAKDRELEAARKVLRAILEPDDELDFGVPSDVTLDWQRIQLLVCAYLRATDAARSTERE